ncbi:RagB/SusD family nutrient uptake outer membrane protein [Chitinophagaceae bacterium 26-R-25]|nr:RagB/SusD family nutrient uptake outer membrane protein [Chitinophagaceae bacterium 26-R-25]
MKKFIIFCLSAFTLFGCKKYLDRDPKAFLSPSTYVTDSVTAGALLNGVYNAVDGYTDGFAKMTPYYLDLASDNCMSNAPWQYFTVFPQSQASPLNTYVQLRWNMDYTGVSRANYFLSQLAANPSFTQDIYKRLSAEAKFLRAYFYHDLVTYWGDVPLILTVSDISAKPAKDDKAKVIAQVLKDLNEAIPGLPTSYSGSNVGRVTKGAALALKARVLLFNKQWAEAAATAKTCMDLNAYSLYPNYFNLFKQDYKDNVTNTEAIFQVFYTPSTNPSTANNLIDWPQSYQPTLQLVNDYYMANGYPITDTRSHYDPNNPFIGRDPRFAASIWYPGSHFKYAPWNADHIFGNATELWSTGFKCRKFINESISAANEATGQAMNKVFIRYAEVLLTYAEAQNEAVGPDASVYSIIDAIRTRAGMTTLSVAMPGLSQSGMRNEIRHERRIELAFEGLRWNDIQRWQIGPQTIVDAKGLDKNYLDYKQYPGDGNGVVPGVWEYRPITVDTRMFNPDKDYLWPIPQTELDANKNMMQNPTY